MVVDSLKKSGRYVTMVGDGVNDVKSIKAANVGVALQSGSGAARGVADMVLVNDSFSALPKAIVEGKRTVTGMRDILRLYLTRNFVLAALVGILLLALGRLPMMPVHNAFYALASVSFAAFLIAIWAKPSTNKTQILPGVLRFSIPMAVMIAGFGFAVYAIFLHSTESGLFALGEDLYRQMYESYGSSSMWSDWDGFVAHISLANESFADVSARNAMLVFLVLAGISQLFFIYPLLKFYSVDGEVSKDLKPTILALLLFGLVVLTYNVPQVAVEIGSLAIFPIEYYLLIACLVAAWFLFAIVLFKSWLMRKISDATESAYQKSLEAETKKEG
jgi:cation-transporting ATPase E